MASKTTLVIATIITIIIIIPLILMGLPKYFLLIPIVAILLLGYSLLQAYFLSKMLNSFATKNNFKIISKEEYDLRRATNNLDSVALPYQNQNSVIPGVGFNNFNPENPIIVANNLFIFAGTRTSIQRGMGSVGRHPVSMNGIFFYFEISKNVQPLSFVCFVPKKAIGGANRYTYFTKLSEDINNIEKNPTFKSIKPLIESSNPELIFEFSIKDKRVILSITSLGQKIGENDLDVFFNLCHSIKKKLS